MTFVAVIVAAGSGNRAGGPKQWRPLAGRPVARWALEAMLAAGAAETVVVIPRGHEDDAEHAFAGLDGWRAVTGGPDRATSVRNGLAALTAGEATPVLVHDAARPFVTPDHIRRLLAALAGVDGAIPALPVADTLKRADSNGLIAATEDRSALHGAQTPQAFRLGALRGAYDRWPAGETPTDDAAVMERGGGRVRLVPGDPRLMKLTFAEDFAMAEALAGSRSIRVGQGFDAHRWGEGDAVWLCGVRIDHDRTLIGHSDADAGLHALTDAILGALGEGDIGDHFPPTDPQWKGAASDAFLAHAVRLLKARGGEVVNADVTLICERPKIRPHRQAMRERLAALLDAPLDAVSVKATTTEGMGFTGRQEGLAAQAVVSVSLAPSPARTGSRGSATPAD